jgi:two-component system LytT family response regulator
MKKVIIIDDEAPARKIVREYLDDFPKLIVLAECNNGVDAIQAINNFQPDLIFLDIQMPGLTGLEILPHLNNMPQIIFATAYDQYAIKAFELNALDYLLKPFTRERFQNAVQRALQSNISHVEQLQQLVNGLNPSNDFPEKILIPHQNKLVAVPTKDIIRIEAEGDYSRLVTNHSGTYLSNFGISKLEEKLDPKQFIRVHRSAIVNIQHITEVYKYGSSYDLRMANQDVVKVSRSYLDKIKKLSF